MSHFGGWLMRQGSWRRRLHRIVHPFGPWWFDKDSRWCVLCRAVWANQRDRQAQVEEGRVDAA